MYTDRIRLVSTEAGVGVRLLGDVASGIGDIRLTSEGQLKLVSSYAKGKTDLSAKAVELTGSHYSEQGISLNSSSLAVKDGSMGSKGAISLTSNGDMSLNSILAAGLNANYQLEGDQALTLNSGRKLISDQSRAYASGKLSYLSVRSHRNRGEYYANGLLTIKGTGLVTLNSQLGAQKAEQMVVVMLSGLLTMKMRSS